MTTEAFDMTDTIIPKSDQLNAEDILTGPITVTITGVTRGNAEQPVNMVTAEFGPGRPYKPSKTMRRVIVNAWGKEASAYVGRRIRIYRDPDVKFGPDKVGGIKISHLSHIDKRLEIALTVTRGRRALFAVDPLPDEQQPANQDDDAAKLNRQMHALFRKAGLEKDQRDDRLVVTRSIVNRTDVQSGNDLAADEIKYLVGVLAAWDREGVLVDKVADILDMAAIEAESQPEPQAGPAEELAQ